MIRQFTAVVAIAALAACGTDNSADADRQAAEQEQTSATDASDPLASNDEASADELSQGIADPEERPIMQAQVVLDRVGFTPGVVDGKMGMSTENAILGFQEANDLEQTGELDDATKQALSEWDKIPATRVVTIPARFAQEEFYAIPDDPQDQGKMERLGYTSLDEKLAERFHTTLDTLKMLNPNGRPAGAESAAGATSSPSPTASASASPTPSPTATASGDGFTPQPGPKSYFAAGQQIRVPNVGADKIAPDADLQADWKRTLGYLGVSSDQPEAAKVVVDKSGGWMKVYDEGDKLVAMFTATMGSSNDPLPLGEWDILGIAKNTPFSYNPELFWDVPDSDPKVQLPPGPNGPVGVVWIDLSKEHYGIHGTPEPQTIGRAQSHGCVRLTNWDAARLAQMVSQSTKVIFQA